MNCYFVDDNIMNSNIFQAMDCYILHFVFYKLFLRRLQPTIVIKVATCVAYLAGLMETICAKHPCAKLTTRHVSMEDVLSHLYVLATLDGKFRLSNILNQVNINCYYF